MTERARRPLLTLKLGSSPEKPAETDAAAAPAALIWKCRPCGAVLNLPTEGPEDEPVRCPACNARVGKAGDFRLDPPPLEKLRARAVKPAPPPPPPVVTPEIKTRAGGPKVVTVKVLKKVR